MSAYKLTLTNVKGEVLDYWFPYCDGSDATEEDGNVNFDLDEEDDSMYLIDEIRAAIGKAEIADHEQWLREKRAKEDADAGK